VKRPGKKADFYTAFRDFLRADKIYLQSLENGRLMTFATLSG
jgi:hypothetical protein